MDSVDPDQMAQEPSDQDLHCFPFTVFIQRRERSV